MSNILDRFTGNISPVALLVSSFFWSWFDIVPFSPALFSAASQRFDIAPIAISFISSAAVLAVFAASGALRSRVIGAKSFCVCSLLFGSLGSVFIYAGAAASPEFFIAGGILIGVYQSVGAVVAGSVATCQGTTNALVHLATALPFNIIAILLVVFLQPFPSVVFAVLLPLLAALCYAVFLVRGNNKAGSHVCPGGS